MRFFFYVISNVPNIRNIVTRKVKKKHKSKLKKKDSGKFGRE